MECPYCMSKPCVCRLDVYSLFPETLPNDPEFGRRMLQAVGINPTANLVQGKTLEGALIEHQMSFTNVIPTDEAIENQWFDGVLPDLGDLHWDAKSRSPGTSSYTVSSREKIKQAEFTWLFIWPLYRVDGSLFVREYLLARKPKSGLTGPPLLRPSKHHEDGKDPSFFWGLGDLKGRETMALDQINSLNLLHG